LERYDTTNNSIELTVVHPSAVDGRFLVRNLRTAIKKEKEPDLDHIAADRIEVWRKDSPQTMLNDDAVLEKGKAYCYRSPEVAEQPGEVISRLSRLLDGEEYWKRPTPRPETYVPATPVRHFPCNVGSARM
jgi:hypothetical protein